MKALFITIGIMTGGLIMLTVQPIFGWLVGVLCCGAWGGFIGWFADYFDDNP